METLSGLGKAYVGIMLVTPLSADGHSREKSRLVRSSSGYGFS